MRISPWLILSAAMPLILSAVPLREGVLEKLREELGPDAYIPFDVDVPTFSARDVGKDQIGILGQFPSSVSGTKHPCVVAIKYLDYSNTYTRNDFQNMLFGTWSSGSAKDYYAEVSYGTLTLAGTVYPPSDPWYTADNNRSYYGFNQGMVRASRLAKEAAQKADPDVNYANFDDNGDGEVDMYTVIHQGYGAEEGNLGLIWSHSWSFTGAGIGAYVTSDPWPGHPGQFIRVDAYTIDPERSSVSNNGSMVCIGVFCHEWGHAFGLPDLYSTTGQGQGLGNWSLMASGSWGGNGSSSWKPAHLDSWSKSDLGWVTFRNVTFNATRSVYAAEDSAVAYRVWTEGSSSMEFFLVENRQKRKFDTTLVNSGLLIYHVDTNLIHARRFNNDVERYPTYGIDLEEADGLNQIYLGTNRGDQGDPYPGSTANTAFDSTGTNPDSRSNAGSNTHCGVNTISTSALSMTAFFYVSGEFQPDNLIKNANETLYIGDSIYEAVPTPAQTKTQTVNAGVAAPYYIKIENDGKIPETYRVTGTGNGATAHATWTVRYFNAFTGGTEITSQVTTAGWSTGYISPGDSVRIRLEVAPNAGAWAFETYDVTVTTSTSGYTYNKLDAVKAITTVKDYYQPDNLIKRDDETDYIGDGIYNSDGTDQTKSSLTNLDTKVFHIKIENDSNTTDVYNVTGTGSGSGWTVSYFDALSGGADITTQVTTAGWSTDTLDPDEYREIRVEITGSSGSSSTYEVLVTSTSTQSPNDPKELDAVKAVVTRAQMQPDAMIRNAGETEYTGNDVYGVPQAKTQVVGPDSTAVYYIRIQNDYLGEEGSSDVIEVRGNGGAAGWTVRYFEGSNDITMDVLTGWLTGELAPGAYREIRLEVTPDSSVADSTSYEVVLTATSIGDESRKDAVTAQTTVSKKPGASEESLPQELVFETSGNMIYLSLPKTTDVSLRVYDAAGRVVAKLLSGSINAGSYTLTLEASSGVYFVKLVTPELDAVRKLVVLN